ncbi:hypothetical protein LX95_00824 [Mesonia algae]|uniref:DUF4292 domain-containing protein n=1 Tax=Mesonia algae TaxID=213248 RepID=A0A2W7K4R6_9FLAO|nr:hypothetical protein [Mesonia algae]PZW42510.1 hypothetical protein LX95_00824 [Mesonia algae]
MRQFLLISAFFLFFSCGLSTLKNLEETQIKDAPQQIENPYFQNLEASVFKSSINVYGKEVSGILIIKKQEKDISRLAFTTEFGNTLLDITVMPTGYIKNFAIAQLDKKIILKTLAADIRTLTASGLKVEKTFRQAEKKVYLTKLNDYQLFYYCENGNLKEIIKTTKTKEKLKILFEFGEDEQVKLINLAHSGIKLNIQLTPIE